MEFTIKEKRIKVSEYQELRKQTNWEPLSENMVKIAMKNTLFSVVVTQGDQLAGFGRVVGDGGIYFYIQDVIVAREFRGMGLSRLIMERIERYLMKSTGENAFIGLMAAEGVSGLYEKYGYRKRAGNAPGMFRMVGKHQETGV